MADNGPILVTGAAGQLGAVGRTVCGLLLDRGLPVRAMVRREDDRAAALRAVGAEVVVGDLLEPADVYRVISGCRRVYFGMSVSAGYLEAPVRGHKTCTGSPESSRTRSTVRSRTPTSPPRIGNASSRSWGCRNTSPGISWRWASCTGRVGMTGWRTAWSG